MVGSGRGMWGICQFFYFAITCERFHRELSITTPFFFGPYKTDESKKKLIRALFNTMVGGVGVLGGHIFFSKLFFFKYIETPKNAYLIVHVFLTLWWVAGAVDKKNMPKF